MAIHIPLSFLSVWEISHRWQEIDPFESDPIKLPLSVRERIRQLLQALTYGLHPYDVHGEHIPNEEFWFTGIRKSKFGRTLNLHLHQGIYDKEFLNSVFIRQDELEKWCWRINEKLPAFWFPGQVNQWGPLMEDDMPQEAKPSKDSAGQPQDEAKQEPPQKEEPTSIHAVARKAAQKRHEPVTNLKQEFFDFWSRGKHKSRADAARKFLASLPADKRRLSPTNAVRTLTDALSKHLRSKGKG